MEIKRKASHRNRARGWQSVVNPASAGTIAINENQYIEITFRFQKDPQSRGHYDCQIILTPDDLGQIAADAHKQALAKSK